MTQVDFYILPEAQGEGRELFACRLAEKAYHLGHFLYIHAGDQEQARRVDELLWTFKPGSFIPHGLASGDNGGEERIIIGHAGEPPLETDVLINLSPSVPMFFSRFLRVAEIIAGDEEQKRLGRERFRFYRDRGYPMNTHNL